MNSWRKTTLGALLKVEHGFAFKSEYFSDRGRLVVLTPGNFHETGGFRERPDKDRFYQGKFPDSYLLKRNDLIVAMTEQGEGLLGSSALIPEGDKYLHNQRLGLVRPKKDVAEKVFLYYLFNADYVRQQIRNSSSGAKVRHTSPERIYRVKVFAPDKPCQRKIAAVLSAYDDLIGNNKRRIALLEKMAEEIYREWFARMRFPGHEKVKVVKGVPEGWTIKRLDEIANFTMGQSPPSKAYNETGEGLPFHQGVGTYGSRFPQKVTYCTAKGRKAKKGDILFSVRAPVGRLNIADCEMIIGRGLAAMSHKACYNSYLFYLLKVVFANEDIIGNGAIFNSVGKDELAKLQVLQPDNPLIERFQSIAEKIDRQIELLTMAMESLTKTRDLLLPRLISGKLSVENLDIQFPPGMEEEMAEAKSKL